MFAEHYFVVSFQEELLFWSLFGLVFSKNLKILAHTALAQLQRAGFCITKGNWSKPYFSINILANIWCQQWAAGVFVQWANISRLVAVTGSVPPMGHLKYHSLINTNCEILTPIFLKHNVLGPLVGHQKYHR